MTKQRSIGAFALLGALALASPRAVRADEQSLYDRLGGLPAITKLVDEFVNRVAADKRVNARFTGTDLGHFKAMLVEQLCQSTGGPCRYSGKDMRAAHAGMNITQAEYDDVTEDLKGAFEALHIAPDIRQTLLAKRDRFKPDIVGNNDMPGAAPAASGTSAGLVAERAQGLREAADLLDKAGQARARGSRSLAEQLFSSAEAIVGAEALTQLAPMFREGAPPRVTTPLKVLPASTPAQPATVGSSEEDEPEAKPQKGSLAGTVKVDGKTLAEGFGVVTLEPASGHFRRRPPRQRFMEQRNRQFAPRLLVVPVGSTVTFPNFDTVYHNVYSRSDIKSFDLGLYKNGQAREMVFDKEGIIRLGCNLHANMSAHIAVVSAPHYTITDGQGRFNFKSLEPGRYKLRAWTERSVEPAVQDITVKPDRNTAVVNVRGKATADPGTDKFGVPRGQAP
jgi:truncated hemoglobin YjbI